MFNSFGNIFRLTSFGESHGKGVGGVIDGFPSGITIDEEFVQQELNRRRPGQSILTTPRKEADKVEFLSGIFEGKSTGCPIGFIVWNENQHSNDYNNLKNVYRPSHADYTYTVKYGIRDHRGGGRSSARETISRVVAGALAKLALRQLGVSITAYTSQVGAISWGGICDCLSFKCTNIAIAGLFCSPLNENEPLVTVALSTISNCSLFCFCSKMVSPSGIRLVFPVILYFPPQLAIITPIKPIHINCLFFIVIPNLSFMV